MDTPLVSVLCTTYKSERYMRGLMDDLTRQTLMDRMEIVICDSASPENEAAIVREYEERFDNIVYFRTPVRETSHHAINRCIERARGKYLTFAATDDRHRADAFEVMARVLDACPEYGLVYPDSFITNRDNETFENNTAKRRYDWPDFTLSTNLSTGIAGPQPMWRREAHDAAGMLDPDILLSGDLDIFLRIAWKCGAVHLRETLGLFLERADSNSGRNNREKLLEETRQIYRKYRTAIPVEDIYPLLRNLPDDSAARVAAHWDLGNTFTLSPYPDFELAVQHYKRAMAAAGDIPGALPQLQAMFCVCAGVMTWCRGDRAKGRQLVERAAALPVGKLNLERMDRFAREKAHVGPVAFALPQVEHDVVELSRMTCGLQLNADGEIVKGDRHAQVPWDVYVGPNGVPVSEDEKVRAVARKPRVVSLSEKRDPILDDIPAPADADSLHVLMVMYGWDDEGGGTVLPRHIAKTLVRRGHRVSVVCAASKPRPGKPAYYVEEGENEGVRIYQVFNRPALFFDSSHPEREMDDPQVRRVIMDIVKRIQPDIVHYHSLLNFSMGVAEDVARAGLPSVYSSHNHWPICPKLYLLTDNVHTCEGPSADGRKCAECAGETSKQTLYAERIQAGARMLSRFVDRHLAPSGRVRDLCVKHGHDGARIKVLRQCPATVNAIWNNVGAKRASGDGRKPVRVAFLGALLPLKGVHTLAQAAQSFAPGEMAFHVYGSGVDNYMKLLKRHDARGRLQFHGRYAFGDLMDILSDVDVMVAPSLCEEPGQLAAMEALAAGVPVVASRIGGFPDYVKHEQNGLLFKPGDAADLARALRRLTDEPGLLERLRDGVGQPMMFEEYVGNVLAEYRDVLAAHARTPKDVQGESDSAPRPVVRADDPCAVRWEGSQFVHHSLAFINRELCLRLIEAGHEVSVIPYEKSQFTVEDEPRLACVAERERKPLSRMADVHVRHQWPPNLTAPAEGHWVMIQPWEFGYVPTEWINVMREELDELWVPSEFVRQSYIASGLPGDRVFVIPNGVDTDRFRPDAAPRALPTEKSFKFLFVGGTIHRKGPDILIKSYLQAFNAGDDVCLVIKDMGGKTTYKGQTLAEQIRELARNPDAPEIVYLTDDLLPEELPGLYTACDCLAHPYRGEGFGMPISEAMACGLPVIVTGAGACRDFCDDSNAWLIPAAKAVFPEKKVDHWPTPEAPYLYEPDVNATAQLMRRAFENPDERRAKGASGRRRIREGFTWDHAAALTHDRICALRLKPVRRFAGDITVVVRCGVDAGETAECLAAVKRHTRDAHELMVQAVGGPEIAAPDGLQVCHLPSANRCATLAGALHSGARYVALLGSDVAVTPRWLDTLTEAADSDAAIAAVGPVANRAPAAQQVAADYDSLKKGTAQIRGQAGPAAQRPARRCSVPGRILPASEARGRAGRGRTARRPTPG